MSENRKSNRLFGFTALLPVVSFDASNKTLNEGGLASGEVEVGFDVHGFDVRKIAFESCRLHLRSQRGEPMHDSVPGSG